MGNSFSSATGYNSTTTTTTSIILHRILSVSNQLTVETYTKNWIEDAIAADVIPMDELIADHAEWKDSHSKAFGILQSTSGIASVISSSIFIWMILRSHERLSTTQHRLFLGLCVFDIIHSLSLSTFKSHTPSELNYLVWNARGNQATCNVLGFLVMVGVYGGLLYNASLNLYFLAVVKYDKSDEFIRAKIEPFLHGVPIVVALSHSIYRLVKEQINDNGRGNCVDPMNGTPHCVGYDVGEIREGFDIPCWRGIEGVWTAHLIQMILKFTPELTMIVSLGMIYTVVKTQERKLARYGRGSLKPTLQQQLVNTPQQRTAEDKQSSAMWGRIRMSLTALSSSLKSRTLSCKQKSNVPPTTRSNNAQSQSRAVMHKAFGYTFAWFLSYGCYLVGLIISIATGSFPLSISYLAHIFGPLQGVFNLLIFMHPKIMAAKKSRRGGGTVSWCQACSTAFWSKGKGGKNQGANRSKLRGSNNSGRTKKIKGKGKGTNNVKSPTFGRIDDRKKKKHNTPQEEEKCEIQVPDNLNPSKTKAMHAAASTATYARNIGL